MCVDILSTWTRLVKRSIISRDFLLWYYWGNKLTNLFISQRMRALSLLPLWVSGTMHQNRNIQSRSLFCYRQCSIFRVPLVFQNELDLNLNQCYLGKEQPAAPEPPWLTPQGETLSCPQTLRPRKRWLKAREGPRSSTHWRGAHFTARNPSFPSKLNTDIWETEGIVTGAHLFPTFITVEHYSAVRKEELLPFVTTRMNLLSEISQRKRNTVSSHFYAETF